jgi:hypothetical protein
MSALLVLYLVLCSSSRRLIAVDTMASEDSSESRCLCFHYRGPRLSPISPSKFTQRLVRELDAAGELPVDFRPAHQRPT